MAKHRSYSIEFKRRVAQEFLGGETLHGLARRHLVSRNLIRIWVAKFEAGGFDDDTVAAEIVQRVTTRPPSLRTSPTGARSSVPAAAGTWCGWCLHRFGARPCAWICELNSIGS